MTFIAEAVASIQAIPDLALEVLVCDGGSTDGTLDYVRSLGDSRFRIVSQSDAGVADALNQAFEAAEGSVFCWLNSDDFFVNQHEIPRLVRRLADGGADRKLGWIVAPTAVCDAAGRGVRLYWPWLPIFSRYRGACNICTVAMFFHRDVFRHFAGFSVGLTAGFEYELIAFLMREGGGETWAGAPLGCLRTHDETITARWRARLDEERERLVGAAGRVDRLLARVDQLIEYVRRGSLVRVLRARRELARQPWMSAQQACQRFAGARAPQAPGGSAPASRPRSRDVRDEG